MAQGAHRPARVCAPNLAGRPGGIADLAELLDEVAPRQARDAAQTVPIVDGSLRLGRRQRVLYCDDARAEGRRLFIQVIGE